MRGVCAYFPHISTLDNPPLTVDEYATVSLFDARSSTQFVGGGVGSYHTPLRTRCGDRYTQVTHEVLDATHELGVGLLG